MLLGVHCSISGGLHKAFNEASSLGIDTFQIFTKNQRQWKEKIVGAAEKTIFINSLKNSNIKTAFSHASYLINLAGDNDILWERSVKALTSEVQRCNELGLKFTILHPGYAKSLSEQEGIKKTIRALKTVIHATKNSKVKCPKYQLGNKIIKRSNKIPAPAFLPCLLNNLVFKQRNKFTLNSLFRTTRDAA